MFEFGDHGHERSWQMINLDRTERSQKEYKVTHMVIVWKFKANILIFGCFISGCFCDQHHSRSGPIMLSLLFLRRPYFPQNSNNLIWRKFFWGLIQNCWRNKKNLGFSINLFFVGLLSNLHFFLFYELWNCIKKYFQLLINSFWLKF